jgi:hypothetical protein
VQQQKGRVIWSREGSKSTGVHKGYRAHHLSSIIYHLSSNGGFHHLSENEQHGGKTQSSLLTNPEGMENFSEVVRLFVQQTTKLQHLKTCESLVDTRKMLRRTQQEMSVSVGIE